MIDEVRVIGSDNLTHIHTWVYAAHGTHLDMRRHPGVCIPFGLGVIHFKT